MGHRQASWWPPAVTRHVRALRFAPLPKRKQNSIEILPAAPDPVVWADGRIAAGAGCLFRFFGPVSDVGRDIGELAAAAWTGQSMDPVHFSVIVHVRLPRIILGAWWEEAWP